MGRDFIVTKSNTLALGRKKRTVSRSMSIGPNAIKFITLTIVAILAVVYLSQSTAGAGHSVELRDLESAQNKLGLEKERLESEQTRLAALKQIDSSIDKNTVEQVTTVEHLDNTNTAR